MFLSNRITISEKIVNSKSSILSSMKISNKETKHLMSIIQLEDLSQQIKSQAQIVLKAEGIWLCTTLYSSVTVIIITKGAIKRGHCE